MEIETSTTIQQVSEREWENLVTTDEVEQSYQWFRTVEDSHMRDMRYVFVRKNGDLKAAACCFLFESTVYSVRIPFLYVRSPLGTSSTFFSDSPEYTDALMKGLHSIQNEEKTKGLFIVDFKRDEFTIFRDQLGGFASFPEHDNTFIDLTFTDFEDYLQYLDSTARRSVRITLNKARKLNIRTVFTNDFARWKRVAHQLHGYTCQYHNDYRWHVTEQFYDAVETHLKDNAEMVIFFKNEIPLAFGFSVGSSQVCRYKFSGTDPHYKKYHAYFLIYYEGIKRAIEQGYKRIYFGATTYDFKEKIGCKREELYGLAKMKNPLLDLVLKSYVAAHELLGKKL